MAARVVPVVRMLAGHQVLWMAADAVVSVKPSDGEGPHVAELLGVDRDPGAVDLDEERSVEVVAAGARGWMRVDGPLQFRRMSSLDLLHTPPALPAWMLGPVVGLTLEGDEHIGFVVDAPSLLALLPREPEDDSG